MSLCLVIPVHLRNSRCKLLDRGIEDGEGRQALADREKPHGPSSRMVTTTIAIAASQRQESVIGLYKTEVIDRRGPWLSVEGGRPGHPRKAQAEFPYLTVYFCTNGVGTLRAVRGSAVALTENIW